METTANRLRTGEPAQLSDIELVSLVLGINHRTANEILDRIGPLRASHRPTIAELCELPGVGPARAARLIAAIEIGTRAFLAETVPDLDLPIRTPPQSYQHFRDMAYLDTEELHVLALDARHCLIKRFCAARGEQNLVHIAPRDLFRRLLREGAVACIIAHNHPSGDAVPSEADLELTARFRNAGELLGIKLLEHLVIGASSYFSCTAGRMFHERLPTFGTLAASSPRDAEAPAEQAASG